MCNDEFQARERTPVERLPALRTSFFGPGLLVTAAFIGPGTVTTATKAGASFGFAVAWALLFAILATIVLQEMSARLGLVTRMGLGEALRGTFENPVGKWASVLLVVSAITFGNAAYQMGNITGASLGLEALSKWSHRVWAVAVGLAATAILATGIYKIIERVLIALVVVMSVTFIVTAIVIRPDLDKLFAGLFTPSVPEGSLLTVIALIGTTVVPYNLFLHASTVREKWCEAIPLPVALHNARFDAIISIVLGGLVTLTILITATGFYGSDAEITSAAGMARQLEPLLGPWAGVFFAVGLFAAGLTSSITAPLAAAYATSGALGWSGGLEDRKFKLTWFFIIAVGTALAMLGKRPTQAIVVAQAANGLLLPVMAVFLLVVANRHKLLGEHTNGPLTNVLGTVIVFVATGLGLWKIIAVLLK